MICSRGSVTATRRYADPTQSMYVIMQNNGEKKPKKCTYGCAILEEQDNLLLPGMTRTLAEHKTREESVRRDKERATACLFL